MSKQRAFVRYTTFGQIVPGSMIITNGSYPNGPALWAEVSTDLCCDNPTFTSTTKVKGFIRYTKSGKIVPGSLILSSTYPTGGGLWKPVTIDLCCGFTTTTTTTQPPPPGPTTLKITFVNAADADLLVGDSTDIADWNTFFNLPSNGTPFTSVTINNNEFTLYDGFNITVAAGLFYGVNSLISVIDTGSLKILDSGVFATSTITIFSSPTVTTIADSVFYLCSSLTTVTALAVTSIGDAAFGNAISLTAINFPLAITAGNFTFNDTFDVSSVNLPLLTTTGVMGFRRCGAYSGAPGGLTTISLPLLTTVIGPYGDNEIFSSCYTVETFNLPLLTNVGQFSFLDATSAKTINLGSCVNIGASVFDDAVFLNSGGAITSLTVPASRMTCLGGNPDGDIQYLQSTNPLMVITTT